VRVVRRRKFRWLPEAHTACVDQEQTDGRRLPVQEWLALWLWWGVAVTKTVEEP
jgi:hypothetical protein